MTTEEKPVEELMASPTDLDNGSTDCDLELEGIEDSMESELMCRICQDTLSGPKMLTCFHSFCQDCLMTIVPNEEKEKTATETIDGEPIKILEVTCPRCEQVTTLPEGKVENLIVDFLLEESLNPSSESAVIICSSCKAGEKAIAHCGKCPNYLCTNCSAAHQFMRCFEDHKVESFEDILKKGGKITHQKPVKCRQHDEQLVSFCNICQIPVCQKCITVEHVDHQCIELSKVVEVHKAELKNLVNMAREKLETSREISQTMTSDLTDLEEQKENSKSRIVENFQSCKSVLEKIKDDVLAELNEKHSKMELTLMEETHASENNETRLETSCKFTEKVLSSECPAYAAMYKKQIKLQLEALFKKPLTSKVCGTLEFKTDFAAFERAAKKLFGHFVDQATSIPILGASFPNGKPLYSPLGHVMPPMLGAEHLVGHVVPSGDSEFLPTISNTASQLAALVNPPFDSLVSSMNAPPGVTGGAPMMGLDGTQQGTTQSPVMSDSGISMDSGNSNNSATMVNVHLLSKLNLSSSNPSVMIPQTMLEMGSTTATGSVTSGSNSRTTTPMGQGQEGIQGILAVSPIQQSVQTENLEQLATLMHSQPPPVTLPFTPMAAIDMPPVSGASADMGGAGLCGTGASADMGGAGLGSPTGSFAGGPPGGPYPPVRRPSKMSAMQIRCKFGQLGPGKCQFNSPHGFCLGLEQDIIVADTNNHRIQVFEKTGEFKTQFGIPGREEGQLWYPRKVAVMRPSGKFVVCDRGNERSRMQIFTRNGHFLKKIAIRYIDIVAGLAITIQGNIVAVDSVSPTVFVISEAGELIKWFDCSDYMREPSDIAVSNKEYFVCDFKGHCVVVFNDEGNFVRRIGCENITNYPNGIDISDAGDVLIGDSHGNRFHVAVFQRDGSLIGEFQCPYVKVSRCCGLKITSEGYIVTLAKNNHHVLVLNTLYIV